MFLDVIVLWSHFCASKTMLNISCKMIRFEWPLLCAFCDGLAATTVFSTCLEVKCLSYLSQLFGCCTMTLFMETNEARKLGGGCFNAWVLQCSFALLSK